jgi:hypothetical protein
MKFMLGCDPELFLTREGSLYSAIDTWGGTKDNPRPLDELGEGFAVQEDNVALEFNIPPSATNQEFQENVNKIVNYLAENSKNQFGLLFSQLSAGEFPIEQLMDIRAMEFGCDPDYNAWTGKKNPRPEAPNPLFRSAGGHVHVGIEHLSKRDARRLGQLMDLHLGVPSLLIDKGEERKKLYGKAGAMRFKPYGMEYRVLSNFWIFSPSYQQWVWNSAERAIHDLEMGRDIGHMDELLIGVINSNNKKVAAELVAEHGLLMA